jgi:hypothetical protein
LEDPTYPAGQDTDAVPPMLGQKELKKYGGKKAKEKCCIRLSELVVIPVSVKSAETKNYRADT